MTSSQMTASVTNGSTYDPNQTSGNNYCQSAPELKTKSKDNYFLGLENICTSFSLSSESNAFTWLLMTLAIVSLANLLSALWVMHVLQLNSSGMGKGDVNFVSDGLVIKRDANVLGQLISQSIHSDDKEIPLRMAPAVSSSLLLNGWQENSFLSLETDKVEVTTPHLIIKKTVGEKEETLFEVNKDRLSSSLVERVISPLGGLSVQSTVQTNTIHASPHHDIHLESRAKSVYIESPREVNIQSRAGQVKVAAYGVISIHAQEQLSIDSRNVHLTGLQDSLFTATQQDTPSLQVCACESGALFTVPGDSVCSTDSCGASGERR